MTRPTGTKGACFIEKQLEDCCGCVSGTTHIAYDCQVDAIEIIEDSGLTNVPPAANATNNRIRKEPLRSASPSRKSRRLQGEDANIRRSRRTTKQTQAFTVLSHSSLSYDDASSSTQKDGSLSNLPRFASRSIMAPFWKQMRSFVLSPWSFEDRHHQFIPPLPDAKKKAIADMG
ncbi:hypothetical protein MHU86_1508 [Fragilaria crotonensis]|nr:hypothetical protein MHU86_1508 [Fragilaria crotonensis]